MMRSCLVIPILAFLLDVKKNWIKCLVRASFLVKGRFSFNFNDTNISFFISDSDSDDADISLSSMIHVS